LSPQRRYQCTATTTAAAAAKFGHYMNKDTKNDAVRGEEEKEWKNPDSAHDPASYVRYLDGIIEGMQPSGPAFDYKRRVNEMMDIKAGDSIIDIGCGTGSDVLSLSKILATVGAGSNGKGGKVVGVDISETMITEAKKRLSLSQEAQYDNVEVQFITGDAQCLVDEIPSNSIDICRCDRSLQHVPEPIAAMQEMARICKPNGVGRVVVSEPDWETLVIDCPPPAATTTAMNSNDRRGGGVATTRKIINHFCDTRVNGWMGRQLPRLFSHADLVQVHVVPMTAPITDLHFIRRAYLDKAVKIALDAGVVSTEEASEWMSALEAAHNAGLFFSTLTLYCVRGHTK